MDVTVKKFDIIDFIRDKAFFKRALSIAIPVIFQNFLINLGNLIDTLMVASLDAVSVAGVGLANKIFTVFVCSLFGLGSGSIILTSQYFGAKNITGIRRTYFLTLLIAILYSLLYIIPLFFAPSLLMRLFTDNINTMAAGNEYIKIACFSFICISFSMTTTLVLRSMNEVTISAISSACQLIINVIFNYGLINGHFGFPRLGISGAAYATIISRFAEVIIIALYLLWSKTDLYKNIKEAIIYSKEYLKLYFSKTLPTMLNELAWSMGLALFFVAYGRMTADETSAITITYTINDLTQALFVGFCSACAISIGQELGRNELEKAKLYTKYYIYLFVVLLVICMTVLYFGRGFYIAIFGNLGSNVGMMLDNCIKMYCLVMPGYMIGFLLIVGILRGGGDIMYTVIIDFVTCYFIGAPVAFITAVVLKLPPHLCIFFVSLEEYVKAIWAYARYKKYKWLKNLVVDG